MQGRRRRDTLRGELPDDGILVPPEAEIRAGDYWKVLNAGTGEPAVSLEPSNLTGTVWMVVAPLGDGYGLGTLSKHTVREHEDGTISVRPGDGSSNSILISRPSGLSWHGFLEHGVWRQV